MIAQSYIPAYRSFSKPIRLGYNYQIMPYLIDGHNLIAELPNLSLADLDDEYRLIELLQEFCRLNRKQVEVFFDKAAPGSAKIQKYGSVTAHFISTGNTADQAIRTRLRELGRNAFNWTVVSSDLAVQSSAKLSRANILTSEEFTSLLLNISQESSREKTINTHEPEDVSYWLDQFERGEEENRSNPYKLD